MPKKGYKFKTPARLSYYASRRGPRPDKWITGPDPHRHAQHRAYSLHKVRCVYRKEIYLLTSDEFAGLWSKQQWSRRGLQPNQLVLGRIDPRRPWELGNVEIRTCQQNKNLYSSLKRKLNLPREYRFRGNEHETSAETTKEQI